MPTESIDFSREYEEKAIFDADSRERKELAIEQSQLRKEREIASMIDHQHHTEETLRNGQGE